MRPKRYPYSGGKESIFVKTGPESVKTLNLYTNNMNPQLLDANTITWGDILRWLVL